MYLPIQNKPNTTQDYTNLTTIIPNLITIDLANKIKTFAQDTEISGWHRRGSKHNHITASFFTCLILEHNVPIYDILDNAWKDYITSKNINVTFLEPYELKLYLPGDSFGYHNDIQVSENYDVERKLNLLIPLSEETEYEGGELYIGNKKCDTLFGSGIFFSAKYPHCVKEITSGQRYSLIGHAWGPV